MNLKKYFVEHGILNQTFCVETLEQNEGIERKHRHILNMKRALCFKHIYLSSFGSECIITSGYFINRTP